MTGFLSIKTEILRRGSGWWCVLSSDVFELFIKLKHPSILHFSQFIQLHECEFGLAQLSKVRLGVISCYILICAGTTFVKLVEDHDIFMQHPELVLLPQEAVPLEYFQLYRLVLHQAHLLDLLV